MTRMSGMGLIAAIVLLAAPCASLAQNNNSSAPPGTNGSGTAQSSGPTSNREPGVSTGSSGMGSGNAAPPATPNTDATVNAENNTIDRKLKSICRGC
jgi:hypothetical protein